MARSREELCQWALEKAGEYLASARENLKAKRLFPAAEDIFRTVETTLEAFLYLYGVRKIEYPGRGRKFIGRLALQFLVRDTLVGPGRLERDVYERYLLLASSLHGAGYSPSTRFNLDELHDDLAFADDLLAKARAAASKLL